MATSTIVLPPASATIPDGSTGNLAPQMLRLKGTESVPQKHLIALCYDSAGAKEHAWWSFRLPFDYVSGGVLKIQWMYNSTTAGNVKWQASVGAVTPADLDTPLEHAAAAAATVTTAINASEARRLIESSITLTMDGAVAGDYIEVCLFRDSADAADTAAVVDAEVIAVTFEYTS